VQLDLLRRVLHHRHERNQGPVSDVRAPGTEQLFALLALRSALGVEGRTLFHLQEGYTALIAAAGAGQLGCVQLLIQHGADVNTADPVGKEKRPG
jgi:ankyrin repeat protein